jgi:very-short-patch-repair endonuclease
VVSVREKLNRAKYFSEEEFKKVFEKRARNIRQRGLKRLRMLQNWPLLNKYFVDFAISSLKLAIEVDGGYHSTPEQQAKDAVKDANISAAGWIILRVKHPSWEGLDVVIATIERDLDALEANKREGTLPSSGPSSPSRPPLSSSPDAPRAFANLADPASF